MAAQRMQRPGARPYNRDTVLVFLCLGAARCAACSLDRTCRLSIQQDPEAAPRPGDGIGLGFPPWWASGESNPDRSVYETPALPLCYRPTQPGWGCDPARRCENYHPMFCVSVLLLLCLESPSGFPRRFGPLARRPWLPYGSAGASPARCSVKPPWAEGCAQAGMGSF